MAIYTTDQILNEAAVVINEEDEDLEYLEKTSKLGHEEASKTTNNLDDLTADKLNELLEMALEAEDYERAAALRDELNRRN